MEPINVNLSCDIQQPVKVRYLDGYFFSKDSAGHKINVDVFNNGVPVSVGGSVSAEVVRSDGETVPVTGAVSENRAYVILPQAAYAVVGAVQITIKVTEGTTIVTIACFVAFVHESDTEITVDPGTIIPSIQALISQIETAVASIPADYSSLWTSLAPAFSSSTAYAVGQYVTNSGVLYRFTTAHPAGTWNSAHVTAVNLGAEVSNLKSALTASRTGTIIIEPMAFYRYSQDGLSVVDFAQMPLNTYVYNTFSTFSGALNDAGFPFDWSGSDYVGMFRLAVGRYDNAVSVIKLYNFTAKESAEMLYYASSVSKYRWILPTTDLTKQYFPADAMAVGDALALKSDLSALVNGRTNIVLNPFGGVARADVGGDVDFRTFPMNAYCYTTYQYIKQSFADTNFPDNDWADSDIVAIIKRQVSKVTEVENSVITVFNFTKTRKLEMLYFASASGNKYRWLYLGIVNNNTFENTINQYANTYNVTASPNITADTNNYLQPTGDTTDMSTAIETMLASGVCNLAPGNFYVSGIDMPDDTIIRGCGTKTNIILLDSVTSGYAIKMGSRCIVDSVMVSGGTTSPTITSTIGTRDGILWQGTAIPGQSTTSNTPIRGTISNCHIRYFTGSGIRCYGTGTGISNCLNVANVYVYSSTVGTYIEWLSEFHRFVNVDNRGCYYGMINNGGNNTFANCGFSKNIIGLLMDNTNGQSNNNSHGSFSNCVFNHSGNNNDGVAIHIIGCTNGEIFTGCQLFYGEIVIAESEGIVFADCNFGGSSGTQITITNGGLIMYNGCCFKNVPTVTKSGNTATKFVNCYLRDGTAVTIS